MGSPAINTDPPTPMPESVAALNPAHAEALVRVIEGAPQVRRRYHFFMWTQAALQHLLPHKLLIAGAYQRGRKELVLEAFHNIAVPQPVLNLLCDARSQAVLLAQAAWVSRRGQPTCFDVGSDAMPETSAERSALQVAGYVQLLVHGVARPQRVTEIESFFMLASPGREPSPHELLYFDLLLPHLHSAYLRVQAVERELSNGALPPRRPEPSASGTLITAREKQILRWVRDGKNNQQIGEVLDISPLTVKNHIQKILRKLGATNRAQAVAKAIAMNLLAGSAVGDVGETVG